MSSDENEARVEAIRTRLAALERTTITAPPLTSGGPNVFQLLDDIRFLLDLVRR